MKKITTLVLGLLCGLLISCGGGADGGLGGGGSGGGGGGGGPGSGGTGISANSEFVGSIEGFGSIVVGGVHFSTETASITLEDASAFQLGMTTRVIGTLNSTLTAGTATQIVSAADVRGAASNISSKDGTLHVMGSLVSIDEGTVFDGVTGLATLTNGDQVQVHGFPGASGSLRATRIERLAAPGAAVAAGAITSLNAVSQTFVLGSLTVNFSAATFSDGASAATLANGQVVRVRAAAPYVAGTLAATRVQLWYPVTATNGVPTALSGIVTDFTSLASFRLLGTKVDASAAQITGGPSGSIGNGVKIDVTGTMTNGVLVVSTLKIRKIPGTAGPSSFSLLGAVGNYSSAASFRVQGQPVDASGPGVIFTNGTASSLGNGVRVSITGSQVVSGVLIAEQVTFQ